MLTPAEFEAALKDIHENHGDGKRLPTVIFPGNRSGGGGCAYTWARKISVGNYKNSIFLLLHELAHIYTPMDGHGKVWRRCYIGLIRSVVGDKEADALSAAFARNGVSELAAVACKPVRAKETHPRRRFQIFVRKSRIETKEDGILIRKFFEERLATKEEIAKVDASDRQLLRNGFYLTRNVSVEEHRQTIRCEMFARVQQRQTS